MEQKLETILDLLWIGWKEIGTFQSKYCHGAICALRTLYLKTEGEQQWKQGDQMRGYCSSSWLLRLRQQQCKW